MGARGAPAHNVLLEMHLTADTGRLLRRVALGNEQVEHLAAHRVRNAVQDDLLLLPGDAVTMTAHLSSCAQKPIAAGLLYVHAEQE